jgi:hypothetical protein
LRPPSPWRKARRERLPLGAVSTPAQPKDL